MIFCGMHNITLNCDRQNVKYLPKSKEEYSNLLQYAITSKYKKTDKHTATNINKEGVKLAREANIRQNRN